MKSSTRNEQAQSGDARLGLIDGRRGAVVDYRIGDAIGSYAVTPESHRRAEASESVRFERTSWAGFHVGSWREPGIVQAMIGSAPEAQLEQFARACVEKMKGSVAWLGRQLRAQEG